MIDSKEGMEKSNEASQGCLQAKGFHFDPKDKGNAIEKNTKQKDGMHSHEGAVDSNNSFQRVTSTPSNHGYFRPLYHQECWTWPNIYTEVQKVQQNQVNAFENHFHPVNRDCFFPVESRIHYLPCTMFPQGYQHELQSQEFQYFVVIDFEATCDKEKRPHPQEIIEFPSVLVNSATGEIVHCFQTYVRPAYHQLLTEFCKELTGIQQIQVDRGVPLSEALAMHDKWLEDRGIKHKNFAVVTWGDWDCRVMLESECRFKSIQKPPYFNRWINLKVPFQDMFGGVRRNLKEAVQLAGLAWHGRPHCGLDDALNTARLLVLLMHRGFKFTITNELPLQSAACYLSYQPFNHHNTPMYQTKQPQNPKEVPCLAGPFHPLKDPASQERCPCCFCGVRSCKGIIHKPGPMQGKYFFSCGNWTASRRGVCTYFAWASP